MQVEVRKHHQVFCHVQVLCACFRIVCVSQTCSHVSRFRFGLNPPEPPQVLWRTLNGQPATSFCSRIGITKTNWALSKLKSLVAGCVVLLFRSNRQRLILDMHSQFEWCWRCTHLLCWLSVSCQKQICCVASTTSPWQTFIAGLSICACMLHLLWHRSWLRYCMISIPKAHVEACSHPGIMMHVGQCWLDPWPDCFAGSKVHSMAQGILQQSELVCIKTSRDKLVLNFCTFKAHSCVLTTSCMLADSCTKFRHMQAPALNVQVTVASCCCCFFLSRLYFFVAAFKHRFGYSKLWMVETCCKLSASCFVLFCKFKKKNQETLSVTEPCRPWC